MAAARRTRPSSSSQPVYADDSGDETEQDTPKPQRTGLKKRLSEVYNPDADASFGSDPGRLPLRSVNINDDAAEKRRRRKSSKFVALDNAQVAPSETESAAAKQKQQLSSVAPPAVINVPLDVMSSNFEEWMKMATDNVCTVFECMATLLTLFNRKSMPQIHGILH
jgi:condensin complex subunit 2